MTSQPPARSHCFTSFKLNLLDVDLEQYAEIRYLIVQVEVCPDTRREHLQGYVEWRRPVRGSRLRTVTEDSGVYFRPRRDSRDAARDYCRKVETRLWGPYEYGTWIPSTDSGTASGRRTDLQRIREAVENGASDYDIAREHFPEWCRHHRAISRYRALRFNASTELRQVRTVLIEGPTGAGKSYRAWELAPKAFRLVGPNAPGGAIWFDYYEGEEDLIIEDFDGWIPYRLLLTMLDPYPLRLPSKGGFVFARWVRVYITSCVPLDAWYPARAVPELSRRIAETISINRRS